MIDLNAQIDKNNLFFSKKVEGSFEEVLQKVENSLKETGFGIVTELSMDEKLKEKLDVTIEPYKILGICNPKLAYDAIQVEENIGVFLPCTLVIRKTGDKAYEVVTFNPSIMMGALGNPKLDLIANQVTEKLKLTIDKL
jgi:uncharacterized protein (DUF302 family)